MTTEKTRPNFSKKTTAVLMTWLSENIEHPWPSKQQKRDLCEMSGLTPKQLRIWFTNNRKVRNRDVNLLNLEKTKEPSC